MKSILIFLLLFSAWSLKAQTDTAKISIVDSAVYANPEIEASYPGGHDAWLHFLVKNLRYPDKAQENDIQGTVVTRFIVDSSGMAHDVVAISGPAELRDESIRIINKVNMWVPAVQKGKKVNSIKTQPLVFKLVTPKEMRWQKGK
jgi:protein TonB